MNSGIWYALGAYVLWGLFPVYWKWLHHVPAVEVIGHRIGWSFVLLMIVIFATKQWKQFRSTLNRRVLGLYLIAGILLSCNWLIYVWGVNSEHVVETSLGYFINPLFSVLLGMIFLKERLRSLQWLPIGLAAVGVIYLTWTYGSLPWIALGLAFSFGFYGLVKKTSPLGSLFGLTLETGWVFLPALGYLIYLQSVRQGSFGHTGAVSDLLMAGAGVVTTIPLLMFASAAKRIPLTIMGIMQYIAPTLQFLLGVLLYKEPFTTTSLIGFSLVWAALIIFWVEGVMARRAQKRFVEVA
ncbi:MAG: EamA family transporter RarD [Anaerolineales bacterium]|jgi:chloramphenicol-sensitive protein RarD